MQRTSFANWPCSVARTADLLGDAWTLLVLREAFFGVRRFEDLQANLGIGRNVLAVRLRRLVRDGVLERRQYQDRPKRFEYRLTEMGRDFYPVLATLMAWGDKWLDRGRGAPLTLRHATCGAETTATVVCSACHAPLRATDVRPALGPGFPRKLASHPRIRARFGDPTPASTA